jgi:predicted transcriptional regulator
MAEQTLPQLVRDLMTVGVVTCPPEASIQDLAQLLLETGLDDLIVLEDGHAVGVVGQDDLVKALAHRDYHTLQARDILREGIPQVPPDIPLPAAAQIMRDQGIRSLFLMHHASGIEYPAALLTYTHLLRLISARDDDDLSDLGIHADRQAPLERFFQKRDAARRENLGG